MEKSGQSLVVGWLALQLATTSVLSAHVHASALRQHAGNLTHGEQVSSGLGAGSSCSVNGVDYSGLINNEGDYVAQSLQYQGCATHRDCHTLAAVALRHCSAARAFPPSTRLSEACTKSFSNIHVVAFALTYLQNTNTIPSAFARNMHCTPNLHVSYYS